LVTGGLGFIGSNFIRHILSAYDDAYIINLDRLSIGSNPANLGDLKGNPRYRFVEGDIADYDLVAELVKDSDTSPSVIFLFSTSSQLKWLAT